MAEVEVAKSLKKAVDIAKSKEHSFTHKLKEIVGEILVIVFAVSLSIYLHTWSEHREEQHQAHEFIKGLSKDLSKDIVDMKMDIEAYQQQKKLFSYISKLPKGASANMDSINNYQSYLFSYTGLGRNNGRYEGFKSSGKIQFIENEELQNNILDLYEENIPLLKTATEYYKNQKMKFSDYIIENTIDYPKGNLLKVIAQPQIQNRSRIYLSSVDNIISLYQSTIEKSEDILKQIEVYK